MFFLPCSAIFRLFTSPPLLNRSQDDKNFHSLIQNVLSRCTYACGGNMLPIIICSYAFFLERFILMHCLHRALIFFLQFKNVYHYFFSRQSATILACTVDLKINCKLLKNCTSSGLRDRRSRSSL